jgi:RES domain
VNEIEFHHEIHSYKLPLVESSGSWYRITRNDRSSLYFNTSGRDRFSSNDLGIFYVASNPCAVLAETFAKNHQIYPIDIEFIRAYSIWTIEASCPLIFADFTGNGLSIIGQDILALYGNYDMSKHLAKAVWSHPMNVHGIKYRSRYDLNRFNYIIFDRAARYLSEQNLGNLVDDHLQLLQDMSMKYHLPIINLPL